jgi:hypothetical protein
MKGGARSCLRGRPGSVEKSRYGDGDSPPQEMNHAAGAATSDKSRPRRALYDASLVSPIYKHDPMENRCGGFPGKRYEMLSLIRLGIGQVCRRSPAPTRLVRSSWP